MSKSTLRIELLEDDIVTKHVQVVFPLDSPSESTDTYRPEIIFSDPKSGFSTKVELPPRIFRDLESWLKSFRPECIDPERVKRFLGKLSALLILLKS